MKYSKPVAFSRQTAVLSFIFLFTAWVFFFWPTLASIFSIKKQLWLTFSTYGVVIISLYLIVTQMSIIHTTVFISSQLGLMTLFLMAAFFILGQITNLSYAEQSSVMLMLPALVMTAFGPVFVQTIFFPLLYLMFIIPLQDDTLENRPLIVLIALLVLMGYLVYQKHSKLQKVIVVEPTMPVWASANARWLAPTLVAFSMLMVSPWLGDNIRSFYPPKHREIALRAPLGVGGWVGPIPAHGSAWVPLYKNASATLQEEYFNEADKSMVYLYTAYFHSDRDLSDLLNHKNSLYDDSLWKQVAFSSPEVNLGNSNITNVFELTLESQGVYRVVWYWYYVAGMSTVDLSLAQFLDKIRIIAKYAQGSGVVAISTTYTTNPQEAKDRLQAFLSTMYNGLEVLKRPEVFYTRPSHAGT